MFKYNTINSNVSTIDGIKITPLLQEPKQPFHLLSPPYLFPHCKKKPALQTVPQLNYPQALPSASLPILFHAPRHCKWYPFSYFT